MQVFQRHRKLCRINYDVPENNHTPSTEGFWFQTHPQPSGNSSFSVDFPYSYLGFESPPTPLRISDDLVIPHGTVHGIFPTFTWHHISETDLEVDFHILKNHQHELIVSQYSQLKNQIP